MTAAHPRLETGVGVGGGGACGGWDNTSAIERGMLQPRPLISHSTQP